MRNLIHLIPTVLAYSGTDFRTDFRQQCCRNEDCTLHNRSKAELSQLWKDSGCCESQCKVPIVRVLLLDYQTPNYDYAPFVLGVRHGIDYLNAQTDDVYLSLVVRSVELPDAGTLGLSFVPNFLKALEPRDYDVLISKELELGSQASIFRSAFDFVEPEGKTIEDRFGSTAERWISPQIIDALGDRPVFHYSGSSQGFWHPEYEFVGPILEGLYGHAMTWPWARILMTLRTCDEFQQEHGRKPKVMNYNDNFPLKFMTGLPIAKELGKCELGMANEFPVGTDWWVPTFAGEKEAFNNLRVEKIVKGDLPDVATLKDFDPTPTGSASDRGGTWPLGKKSANWLNRPATTYEEFQPDIAVTGAILSTDVAIMDQAMRRTGYSPTYWLHGDPKTLNLQRQDGFSSWKYGENGVDVWAWASGMVDANPVWGYYPTYSDRSKNQGIVWDADGRAAFRDAIKNTSMVYASHGNPYAPHDPAASQVWTDLLDFGRRHHLQTDNPSAQTQVFGIWSFLSGAATAPNASLNTEHVPETQALFQTEDGIIAPFDEMLRSNALDMHLYLDGFLSASMVQQAALKADGSLDDLKTTGSFHTHGFYEDVHIELPDKLNIEDEELTIGAKSVEWFAPKQVPLGYDNEWTYDTIFSKMKTLGDVDVKRLPNHLSDYGIRLVYVHTAPAWTLNIQDGNTEVVPIIYYTFEIDSKPEFRYVWKRSLRVGVKTYANNHLLEDLAFDWYKYRRDDTPPWEVDAETARIAPVNATVRFLDTNGPQTIVAYGEDANGKLRLMHGDYSWQSSQDVLECDVECVGMHSPRPFVQYLPDATPRHDAGLGEAHKTGLRKVGDRIDYYVTSRTACMAGIFDEGWNTMANIVDPPAGFFAGVGSIYNDVRQNEVFEFSAQLLRNLRPMLTSWKTEAGERWYVRVHPCDEGTCVRTVPAATCEAIVMSPDATGYASESQTFAFTDPDNYRFGATLNGSPLTFETDYDINFVTKL